MLHDKILSAINDALDDPEFRSLIARKIVERIAPAIANEEDDHSATETLTGLDANYDPSGLAYQFRSKLLGRRPTGHEDIPALAGFFKSMMDEGIDGRLIFDTLKARGRSAESIWDFRKRVYAAHIPKVANPYRKIAAHAEAEIRRREAQ